jgi:hypothetical protein
VAYSIPKSLLTFPQNQGQGGRYGQYNPYAQQDDQYGQQSAGYGQQGGYDQQQPAYGQQHGGYGQQGGYAQQTGYGQQQTGVAARPEAQTYPSSNYVDEQTNNAYGVWGIPTEVQLLTLDHRDERHEWANERPQRS